MDGLECYITKLSKIKEDNEKNRFDSEFFKKKYILSYDLLKSKNHSTVKNELEVLTDFSSNGSYKTIAENFKMYDECNYAYMVRTTDLEQKNYNQNVKYVNQHTYNFLSKSKVFGGELLINKIGCPGKTFLMPTLNKPVSLGMNLFLVRIKKSSSITEKVLYLYFNSYYGHNIMERKINGTVPLTIDKEAIKSLYIPVFDKKLVNKLDDLVNKSFEKEIQANELYESANDEFNDFIKFDINKLSKSNIAIKKVSESNEKCMRIDAEYYLKKYDDLLDLLSNFETKNLGGENGICRFKKSIEPGSEVYSEDGIPFVRVSDLTKFGINDPEVKIPLNYINNDQLYLNEDTILLSKDGSIGIAYKIDRFRKFITSGALLHLNIIDKNKILPDYLTLVLNSKIVQLQAERDSNGAIIQHWKPEQISNVKIPIAPLNIQKSITKKVLQSFELREQSKNYIKTGIEAINIAIAKDENSAMKMIEGNI